jgi:hypothetical protein
MTVIGHETEKKIKLESFKEFLLLCLNEVLLVFNSKTGKLLQVFQLNCKVKLVKISAVDGNLACVSELNEVLIYPFNSDLNEWSFEPSELDDSLDFDDSSSFAAAVVKPSENASSLLLNPSDLMIPSTNKLRSPSISDLSQVNAVVSSNKVFCVLFNLSQLCLPKPRFNGFQATLNCLSQLGKSRALISTKFLFFLAQQLTFTYSNTQLKISLLRYSWLQFHTLVNHSNSHQI